MPGELILRKYNDYLEAWEKYVHENILDTRLIRDEIEASWKISKRLEVDPRSREVLGYVDGEALNKRIEGSKYILDITRPFMYSLHDLLRDDSFVLRFTDADGYVLDFFGNESILNSYKEMGIVKGVNLRESYIGTNATGIALRTGQAIQVMGPEHFRESYHNLTTSSAAIVDGGRVVGTISMSGDYRKVHPHTLGMVVAAAQAISHELELYRVNDKLERSYNHSHAIMESISEGIICLDEKGKVHDINLFARDFLGLDENKIVGKKIAGLLDPKESKRLLNAIRDQKKMEDAEVMIRNSLGLKVPCLVNLTPLCVMSSAVKEAVLTFRQLKSVHNLVNKIVGASAVFSFSDILGESKKIKEAIRLAGLSAMSDATVLILGESGTGKELFAQSIHNASNRKESPFVFLNCGAIPRDLVASELFGYVEGAFTGARQGGHPGKFELADGGTIFLDEIGDMPLDTQANLLRVLETKEVVRVGGHDVKPVDVRVIAATNKDLKIEVEKGNFRSDLFYRLNVMLIHTPPLRERTEDIPILIQWFVDKYNIDNHRHLQVEDDFIKGMMTYDWPGNVRELQNVLQQVFSTAYMKESLGLEDVPSKIFSSSETIADAVSEVKSLSLNDLEVFAIKKALKVTEGNMSESAKLLGIGRTTLYRKMEKHKIE